jgi:hypothetical protein
LHLGPRIAVAVTKWSLIFFFFWKIEIILIAAQLIHSFLVQIVLFFWLLFLFIRLGNNVGNFKFRSLLCSKNVKIHIKIDVVLPEILLIWNRTNHLKGFYWSKCVSDQSRDVGHIFCLSCNRRSAEGGFFFEVKKLFNLLNHWPNIKHLVWEKYLSLIFSCWTSFMCFFSRVSFFKEWLIEFSSSTEWKYFPLSKYWIAICLKSSFITK